jgi:tetratricopeptide (TPR) repeat protein
MSWTGKIQQSSKEAWRGAFVATERSLKEALQYAKENFPRTDSRLAITLSLLGHTFFVKNDFERAEQLLEQARRLHRTEDASVNPCLTMDLFCLIELKCAFGKYSEAAQLCDEIRKHVSTLQTPVAATSREVATILSTLADTISSAESAALDEMVESLPLPTYEEAEGGSFDEVWQHQFQTGLASMRTDEAETDELITAYLNLESAYRLASSMFKPNDMRSIATVKALADACTRLRMFTEAEALYRQAIASVRTTNVSADAAGNSIKLALALLYIESGQFGQAHAIFSEEDFSGLPPEAEPLRKRIDEANQLLSVYLRTEELLQQAAQAEEMQDLERAAKLANNALSQLKQGFPPGHIENARVIRYRSDLLMKLGNDEQAMELMQRAERIERSHEAKRSEWARLVQELPKIEMPATVSS